MDSIKSFVFPNSGSQPDDGVAWWMKYLCKAAGILSGIGKHRVGSHHLEPKQQVYRVVQKKVYDVI